MFYDMRRATTTRLIISESPCLSPERAVATLLFAFGKRCGPKDVLGNAGSRHVIENVWQMPPDESPTVLNLSLRRRVRVLHDCTARVGGELILRHHHTDVVPRDCEVERVPTGYVGEGNAVGLNRNWDRQAGQGVGEPVAGDIIT